MFEWQYNFNADLKCTFTMIGACDEVGSGKVNVV
jgi:hypothetical protein